MLGTTAYTGGWFAQGDTPTLNVNINPIANAITFQEGTTGDIIHTYHTNELTAVLDGANIDIVQDASSNIQFKGLEFNTVTINGLFAGNNINDVITNLNSAFTVTFSEYRSFLESEVGITGGSTPAPQAHFYFIESPDTNFNYPLFKTDTEANDYDLAEGGTGTNTTTTFIDDLTGTTWYKPQGDVDVYNVTGIPNGLVDNGTAIIGTADVITDSVDIIHTINVTRANNYGSDIDIQLDTQY